LQADVQDLLGRRVKTKHCFVVFPMRLLLRRRTSRQRLLQMRDIYDGSVTEEFDLSMLPTKNLKSFNL
jgi:hypothetical protein